MNHSERSTANSTVNRSKTRKDSQAAVTPGHLLGMHCASVSIRLLGKVIAVCQAVEGCLPGFRFKADSS
ncbi:hypothetical protein V6N11_014024 [Hibiscus sabdariffa]|uniref:Uncharacterized protein n=2 Tax=Hibiscus sabdariffa TaxID=183260 RepID=A0ABR2AFF7_9ROSI